jgi:phenylacetate 2-hydroxylase
MRADSRRLNVRTSLWKVRSTANMTIPIYAAGIAVLCFFLYKFLYGTDTPPIKGLPEVPGLPLFGSLFELGTNHAKVAQGWAKKYGPVFQVRMGNRVSQNRKTR